MRGFHPKDLCMKKTLDQLKDICVHKNISLLQGADMSGDEENTEEYERCLHASLTPSKDYFTDSGASNHMVASRIISLYQEDLKIIWEMNLKSHMLIEVHIKSIMIISFPLL